MYCPITMSCSCLTMDRIRGLGSWPRVRIAAESVAILQAAEFICYHICSAHGCADTSANSSESVILYNIISLGISYSNTCIDMYMTYDRWRVLKLALEDNGDQDVEEDMTEPIGWPSVLALLYVLLTISPAWVFFMIIGPAVGWNMKSGAFFAAWTIWFDYVATIGTIGAFISLQNYNSGTCAFLKFLFLRQYFQDTLCTKCFSQSRSCNWLEQFLI
jgi:hypothetical protein